MEDALKTVRFVIKSPFANDAFDAFDFPNLHRIASLNAFPPQQRPLAAFLNGLQELRMLPCRVNSERAEIAISAAQASPGLAKISNPGQISVEPAHIWRMSVQIASTNPDCCQPEEETIQLGLFQQTEQALSTHSPPPASQRLSATGLDLEKLFRHCDTVSRTPSIIKKISMSLQEVTCISQFAWCQMTMFELDHSRSIPV